MFVANVRRGYQGTAQIASGLFLILFTNENAPRRANGSRALRALVRKVALHQTGHFMMGSVTFAYADAVGLRRARFSLSGTYGGDGLPVEITDYKRRNVPPKPEEFESAAECDAYYEALAKIPFENVERAPGLWDRLHPVPDEIADLYWTSGGHNCAGAEEIPMRAWATANIDTLRHLR